MIYLKPFVYRNDLDGTWWVFTDCALAQFDSWTDAIAHALSFSAAVSQP